MSYLLDAHVFIQARNMHYGFDTCPGFWDWLDLANKDGRVFSIQQVRDELTDDELSNWATGHPDLFYPFDATVKPSLTLVSKWAYAAGYDPAAVATFLHDTDYFLVGAALAGGHTVVTHEIAANSTKKIKIPDACLGVGVPCITPFRMLHIEDAKFVLEVA